MRLLFAAIAATALIGAAASAESPKTPKAIALQAFGAADIDKSATLSPEEFDAAAMGRFGIPFEGMDLDSDGAVSEAEYLELFEMHHGQGKQEA